MGRDESLLESASTPRFRPTAENICINHWRRKRRGWVIPSSKTIPL